MEHAGAKFPAQGSNSCLSAVEAEVLTAGLPVNSPFFLKIKPLCSAKA